MPFLAPQEAVVNFDRTHLARVPPSLGQSGTEHVVGEGGVRGEASVGGHDGNGDFLQRSRKRQGNCGHKHSGLK